jgi:hypothetical protein
MGDELESGRMQSLRLFSDSWYNRGLFVRFGSFNGYYLIGVLKKILTSFFSRLIRFFK